MRRPADLVDGRSAVAPALVLGQVCTKCGEDLPFSAFAMRSDGRRRQSWCRKCTLEAMAAWRGRRG
jgi:hypothetical protein